MPNITIPGKATTSSSKRHHTPEFKLKVVLELLQRDTTIEAVKRKFNVHNTQLRSWKKLFIDSSSKLAEGVFIRGTGKAKNGKGNLQQQSQQGKSLQELTTLVGELTIENSILKKALESLE